MARLNLENLSGLLAMETMLSSLAPPGTAAGQDAFDEHLLRAQSAAAPAAPEDYGRRDAGYGPSPERRAAEPGPAARDDTRPDSGGSGLPEDSDRAGTAGGPASDAPGPSGAQEDLPREPATAETESPKPEESQDDASDPKTAAAESGPAGSGQPASAADRDGKDRASEKVEHQDQVHPAARRSKTGKTAGKEPACAEGNEQGEPAADAAPGGRADQPTEGQAAGASDGSQPAQEADAEAANAKSGQSGGPQDAAAVVDPQAAEAQAAVQAAATASPAGGPGETAPATAEVLPAATLDGLTSTQAPGADPRHGPSRAGAKGAGPSHPAAVEPDVQPAAEKPNAAQEGKQAATSPASSDLASAAAATGKPDMAQGNPADGPAAAADPAATKQGERAARPAGAERAERAPGSEQADRVRFVQRVARAFESAAERGGTVRLRLHPPELGSLRIELTVRDGRMNARLEAETEAARNLIVDNLPALRQRLAEHQIRVERFDVDWGGRSSGNLPQQSQDGAERQPGRTGFKPLSEAGSRGGAAAPPVPQAMPRPGDGGRFDVVI